MDVGASLALCTCAVCTGLVGGWYLTCVFTTLVFLVKFAH